LPKNTDTERMLIRRAQCLAHDVWCDYGLRWVCLICILFWGSVMYVNTLPNDKHLTLKFVGSGICFAMAPFFASRLFYGVPLTALIYAYGVYWMNGYINQELSKFDQSWQLNMVLHLIFVIWLATCGYIVLCTFVNYGILSAVACMFVIVMLHFIVTSYVLANAHDVARTAVYGALEKKTEKRKCEFAPESRTSLIPWRGILSPSLVSFYLGKNPCKAPTFSTLRNDVLTITDEKTGAERRWSYGSNYLTDYKKNHPRYYESNLDKLRTPALTMNQYTQPVILNEELPSSDSSDIYTVSTWLGDVENVHSIVNPLPKFTSTKRQVVASPRHTVRKPDVMVVGVDAVSRSQFMRQMQQSVKALEAVGRHGHEGQEADFRLFQFFRYNTIGRGTDGNLKPFLYGPTIMTHYTKGESVWEHFADKGYVTAQFYDLCDTTNEMLPEYADPRNTKFQPPHHWHAFGCRADYDNYGVHNNFYGPYSMRPKCAANKLVHDLIIDGLVDMWTKYHKLNVPRWGFSWSNHGHEGSGAIISTLDPRLSELVKSFDDPLTRHIYEDTILVIASDHGNHMGMVDLDDVMRHEENMPLLLILVPTKYLTPEVTDNLLHNEQALVTIADLRDTLISVSGGFDSKTSSGDIKVGPFENTENLFHSKIDHNRTCATAGIARKYCACFPN